jgi:hypothetical protein
MYLQWFTQALENGGAGASGSGANAGNNNAATNGEAGGQPQAADNKQPEADPSNPKVRQLVVAVYINAGKVPGLGGSLIHKRSLAQMIIQTQFVF